ncbi:hypothetical protein [Nocardiopsis gilva]|uniref:hypothetical protein n=1 Tax=Nocardiopsis gilva TaxID=280236 RepID=UPI0012FD5060|nr:hypothetical protein [Nocardiopsis gilva]
MAAQEGQQFLGGLLRRQRAQDGGRVAVLGGVGQGQQPLVRRRARGGGTRRVRGR